MDAFMLGYLCVCLGFQCVGRWTNRELRVDVFVSSVQVNHFQPESFVGKLEIRKYYKCHRF